MEINLIISLKKPGIFKKAFLKRQVLFFQKRFLKFSDFSRNHNEIYFLGKYGLKFVIIRTDTWSDIYKWQSNWQLKY